MANISSSEQQFVKRLTEIVDANLQHENFGVNELAEQLGMSRITLHRKVKAVIKKSVSEFIRETRLNRALELLQKKEGTVSEIAFRVGFGSVTYFQHSFHDHFGFTPGEALKGLHPPVEVVAANTKTVKKSNIAKRRLIFILIPMAAVLLIAITVFITRKIPEKRPQEKSIAILPFINDSADTTNLYFINGVTEAILNNLAAIADLRVVSRQSSEQYRNNTDKSIREIARELSVNYIVEGSGQKAGNSISLTIQLIDARNDTHIFSQLFERDLQEIFNLQSEIALLVAHKIDAVITSEEKKQIERKPTNNIAALNQFLKGNEIRQIADVEKNTELFKQAEKYLRKAVKLDSTYVAPYVGLGWIYNVGYGNLDSGLYFANRAIRFDPNDDAALGLKGWILMQKGLYRESKELHEKAIRYNPNNRDGYALMGTLGFFTGEYSSSISYILKALNLSISNYDKGTSLISLCNYLYLYGFYDDGLKFAEMQIEINNDSMMYYTGLTCIDLLNGKDSVSLANSFNAQRWNAGSTVWWQPYYVAVATKSPKSAAYADEIVENSKKQGYRVGNHYLGYAYRLNIKEEKAKVQFETAVNNATKVIKEKKEDLYCRAYFNLFQIYSAMNDNRKALENLKLYNTCNDFLVTPFKLNEFKTHPIFESIRKEPEFQQFIKKHDDRIQPEMKKIEKILKNYWSEN